MEQRNNDVMALEASREKTIVRTSLIGILVNALLVGFKAFVGLLSNSIAIILDAVNNFSDALSSLVTIIGAKLGAKKPDKKHPLGYGRIEYLSSMIVAGLVLYAGITSIVESIKKIITPEAADYKPVTLIIVSVAIVVKLALGFFFRKQGKKVKSGSLTASGSDALFDAILSTSVLVSAIVYLIFEISLEAYVGIIIALFIIKAGIEMMIETLNDIIGKREDPDMVKNLKKVICEQEGVLGAYDVTLFNYGPNRNYGSVHLELPDTMNVSEVDKITREVQSAVFHKTGIILTGIGVYSYNTSDDEVGKMRNAIQKVVLSHEWALQLHGFYVDRERKTIRFDVVVSFDADPVESVKKLKEEVSAIYPEYDVLIIADVDVAD